MLAQLWVMNSNTKAGELPSVRGIFRDCTTAGKGFTKFAAGDIAVVDAPDISRTFAQRLVDMQPAAVINASEFSTGLVPNYGPQLLADAGITLIDEVGPELIEKLKNGKRGFVTPDGQVFQGKTLLGTGKTVDPEQMEEQFAANQQQLVERMEAFFGNTIAFIHSEAPLLIDGLGIPDVGALMRGKEVVVVSPSLHTADKLRRLQPFIEQRQPVIIGVDGAADTLVAAGIKPQLIVGDPEGIGDAALRCGAKVILPADTDGVAPGLARIQDLGIGAMTFPAYGCGATELALLLAQFHGAGLVITVGSELDLNMMLRGSEGATPAALLARARVGSTLIDSDAVVALAHVPKAGLGGWFAALVAFVLMLAVFATIAGISGAQSFQENIAATISNMAFYVKSFFA